MADRSEVVILEDISLWHDKPGRYAIARASDWCQYGEKITIWRGPKMPNEVVETTSFREVGCKTVLVDNKGFFVCTPSDEPVMYPCGQITEDLKDEIGKEAEEVISSEADRQAAETISYIDHEELLNDLPDGFDKDIWAWARFEDWVAVNGHIIGNKTKPPKGWIDTDKGGRTDGGEFEVQIEDLIGPVTTAVSKRLKIRLDELIVRRILEGTYEKNYEMATSGYGSSEVWVSKRAMKELEKIEAIRLEEKSKRRAAEWAANKKAAEEKQAKEAEEFRQNLRKGGFPNPRDWSPRGELPGF